MREFALLEAACRYGRLTITEECVEVRPAAGMRWGAHHWRVPREKVTGVSSYRSGFGRDLLIHTNDGHSLLAQWVAPQQVLPAIQLLGHARMALPDEEITLAGLERPNRHVRQGNLVITETQVAVKPRFLIRRKHHWTVPRDSVTGVVTTRHPGMRMVYDVTIHTSDGRRHRATHLSPDNVIHVTRQLGHISGAPPLPLPVREDRAALAFALPRTRDQEQAEPEGLWAAEDGGVWEIEPERGLPTMRGWGARARTRERVMSIRFGTIAAAVLLCVYATAALLSGRVLANGADFSRNTAPPPVTSPAPAHVTKSAPTLPGLSKPSSIFAPLLPALTPAPHH